MRPFWPLNWFIRRSSTGRDMSTDCIFCLIASGEDEEAEIVKQNKELVCFKDIYPAAPHHYLVVPRQHIYSCFSLHRGHISLVKKMAEMGKAVLREQGITDMTVARLGFHQPPYISVGHLHLHVIAPASQISPYMLYKFIPETESFITEESLRRDLQVKHHCSENCMCPRFLNRTLVAAEAQTCDLEHSQM
ncbi:histidine triad nucleotide-binding protein 3-like [Stegastes partitus]|uniref:Histidine triad nucleotide-binding protein 3-like n=1 Tax=Stegastes partitus TaxID=144197 RepID=A0A3B4ZGA6_9TELE|nr:PREDICTED: histidine triad nucleotide-binding protein 3-like [Stegastes partitus]